MILKVGGLVLDATLRIALAARELVAMLMLECLGLDKRVEASTDRKRKNRGFGGRENT